MKFILKFLMVSVILATPIFSSACSFNGSSGSSNPDPTPPEPKAHDISYWQDLKEQNLSYSNDCDSMLQEIKNSKYEYDNQQTYQCALDEVTAEKNLYQAKVNDCDYQILLLEKINKFTPEQKTEAISSLQSEISNLKNELLLKQKYPDDYPQSELQDITQLINVTQTILNNLLKS